MRILIILFSCMAFFNLCGCTYFVDSRCKADKFFCMGEMERNSRIPKLSDDRLLELSEIEFKFAKPPTDTLPKEIGRRGVNGKVILLKYLNDTAAIDQYFFSLVALNLKRQSNIDICIQNNLQENKLLVAKLTEACGVLRVTGLRLWCGRRSELRWSYGDSCNNPQTPLNLRHGPSTSRRDSRHPAPHHPARQPARTDVL